MHIFGKMSQMALNHVLILRAQQMLQFRFKDMDVGFAEKTNTANLEFWSSVIDYVFGF